MYKEKIDTYIAEAMKSGDKVGTNVWRAIKNEFILFEKNNPGKELDETVEIKIMSKMVSSRKESFEIYDKAGRQELANNEKNEFEFIEKLLPAEPNEEEIKEVVKKVVSKIENPTMKDMKFVSSEVKKEYPLADGGLIFKNFKEIINK